jgi:response regulator RpfG family c-di-GMP phosphodiesterase
MKSSSWPVEPEKTMAETVLVVDDEKDVLHSIMRLLADLELDILTAGRAGEALQVMTDQAGRAYDPALLELFQEVVQDRAVRAQPVPAG